MKKTFNITGLRIPEKHYMVDTSAKLDAIMTVVDKGEYFVINRPTPLFRFPCLTADEISQ